MIWHSTPSLILLCMVRDAWAIYTPLREYAGNSFLDQWAYYGGVDNTTWGNVTFVDKSTAAQKQLTFVNAAGNVIIQVDNQTMITEADQANRDTIRLTSPQTFGVGTLILIDALHIPYGCSVWPSFWTFGAQEVWPQAGAIDIITGINGMPSNQIALHTPLGCVKAEAPGQQTGVTLEGDCSKPQGCFVAETKPNSFGAGFANAGGGVFALQFEETGIYSWFWSRPDIPDNVRNSNSNFQPMDTSTWGIPSAAYPASTCNIVPLFQPQNLVISTTLCGVWAGSPDAYSQTCKTSTNSCVADNIIGPGNNFSNAFWEIKYIRTYNNSFGATASSLSTSASQTSPPGAGTTPQDLDPSPTNAAHSQGHLMHWVLLVLESSLFLVM